MNKNRLPEFQNTALGRKKEKQQQQKKTRKPVVKLFALHANAVIFFITNIQNISNLIGREEYNIDHNLLLAGVLYSVTKIHTTTHNKNIRFSWREK